MKHTLALKSFITFMPGTTCTWRAWWWETVQWPFQSAPRQRREWVRKWPTSCGQFHQHFNWKPLGNMTIVVVHLLRIWRDSTVTNARCSFFETPKLWTNILPLVGLECLDCLCRLRDPRALPSSPTLGWSHLAVNVCICFLNGLVHLVELSPLFCCT